MNQILLSSIPLEFSPYQRDVAIALMENFRIKPPSNSVFVDWDYDKNTQVVCPFVIKNNPGLPAELQIKTGASSGVLLANCIRVNAEILFFANNQSWSLTIWQDWSKPFLPTTNVLTAQQSLLKDVSFLIANPTAPSYNRLIEKYCKNDYSLPEDLIGPPRAIAEFLSDNFDWKASDDNSHLYLNADFDKPEITSGVKILQSLSHWHTKHDRIEEAIILFKSDRCFFSRKFMAHWFYTLTPMSRKLAKAHELKSIGNSIADFAKSQIIREHQAAKYN